MDWDNLASKATELTKKQFAAEASSLIKLTDKEIAKIVPNGPDREKLAKLMKEVKDATKDNQAKAKALGDLNEFANVIFPLLKKLI